MNTVPFASDWCRRVVGRTARARRCLRSPLGVLLAAAGVAAACGLLVHPRVFALTGGLLAVAASGVGWPWVTVRGVRASIRFDRERATEGEAVRVTATVANHLPWPAVGLTVRGGFDPAAPVAARLSVVPARSAAVAGWRFIPPDRGVYPTRPPRAATGFPFGVWESARICGVERELLVWPRTMPVGPVPAAADAESSDGNVARNKVGASGEVLGVRPYRRGDSPRRIHRGQTAKHDRLIVCELESTARPEVLLILDTDPAVHTIGPDGTREWAVRVLASLARGWLEAGARVAAAWPGTFVPAAAGAVQAARILDGLARLSDRGGPAYEGLAAPAVRAVRAGVAVGVTTDAGRTAGAAGVRWVVLNRAGFPGASGGAASRPTCDEGPPQAGPRPWVELTGPDLVPHQLRNGWAEAKHGS